MKNELNKYRKDDCDRFIPSSFNKDSLKAYIVGYDSKMSSEKNGILDNETAKQKGIDDKNINAYFLGQDIAGIVCNPGRDGLDMVATSGDLFKVSKKLSKSQFKNIGSRGPLDVSQIMERMHRNPFFIPSEYLCND